MQEISPLFYIIVLIFSVIVHEIAHGYAALHYGDHTAQYQGRLTLNPLPHMDLYGSIILPVLLLLTHAPFLIGWAKPVPYNPDNFSPSKRRSGELFVASAGILTNLFLAALFSIVIRVSVTIPAIPSSAISLLAIIVLVNIVLAVFNLVPIPPLDGSKILFSLIGYKAYRFERVFEKYSLLFLLVFVFFLWQCITPLIFKIFTFGTGIAL